MSTSVEFDSYYGDGNSAAIAAVEQQLGRPFPNSYKDVVKRFNGAFIVDRPYFRYFSRLHGEEVESGTGMFLAFGDIEGCTETMEIKLRFPPEGLVPGLVIFSALGNGDALCFDYRECPPSEEPPVVIWHHEGVPGSEEEVSPVASTFAALLDRLYED
ncbi:hypothetical protein M2262_005188 [Pseudomonas sp. BIGb0408]|uniref:Knr4/Smi1-like domain-containing protein n=1 Tax=Phytopseudomonas flavescens TaxID=29435 RepID=A0A7Y9XQC2_9GAMM|nr:MULTISPECIES: SMI1/KNR4 family protein [Pseudomonas]MCW2295138.1 hypothetical protein [Pseudomonas sp. BIGb0408]NYH75588.1 hypothetical protein [Pseudomonas flavescens]